MIAAAGEAKGEDGGCRTTILNAVRALMSNLGLTASQYMDALNILKISVRCISLKSEV